ncbi:MAG: hypothetical protein M3Z75_29215 [Actinomycetota bacterium]|nr:hypothetical protein [Actinomycetota bacterium]
MNTPRYPERHMPHLSVNLEEITSRLRDLITAEYCGKCDSHRVRAVTDIAQLTDRVYELYAALAAERLRSANLEAAIRAALGAHADGDFDPLGYLRDELAGVAGDDAYGA